MKKFLGLLGLVLALAHPLQAAPLYGAELELTNPELRNQPVSTVYAFRFKEGGWASDLAEKVKEKCGSNCKYERFRGKFGIEWRVTLPNGFYFQISWDPAVVEILTKPSTLLELKANAENMETYLYQPAREIGLNGSLLTGGHFNIGLQSAFANNTELFLKFFIDNANHPELALGILGQDIYNGPPLSVLSSGPRNAMAEVVDDYYDGLLDTPVDVIMAIQKTVYTESYKWSSAQHYQSVGLESTPRDSEDRRRVELRSVRSQENFEQFVLMAELMEARIEYLRKNKEEIIYLKSDETFFMYQQQANLFWVYLNDMGLAEKYNHFTPLLSAQVRGLKPDLIFSRSINWSSWSDQNEILWWAGQSLKSAWIREQLVRVLADSKSQDMSARVIETVQDLIKTRDLSNDAFLQSDVALFVNRLKFRSESCAQYLR